MEEMKMKTSLTQRLLALLLVVCLVIPMAPTLTLPVKAAATDPVIVVAGSDFQHNNAGTTVSSTLSKIKEATGKQTLDGFLFAGDYTNDLSNNATTNYDAGVAGLKGSETAAVGGTPKEPYIDATNLERPKYGLMGDKAEIYKTEIMRQYPFPEFPGENFIRENASWDQIAMAGWKLRWFSKVIYLCEYIADGLTQNTNAATYAKNFEGFTFCTKLFLQTHSGIQVLNKLGAFCDVAKRKGLTMADARKILGVGFGQLLLGKTYYGIRQAAKGILKRNAKH
jgi:hypothetical protein